MSYQFKVTLLVAFALSWFVFAFAVFAQDSTNPDLFGGHPGHNMVDPYRTTKNISGGDCCHGSDCQRFFGTPIRATVGGKKGWKFGEWFVEDARVIDVNTLPVEERGYHHICIHDFTGYGSYEGGGLSTYKMALCGYIAAGV